MVTVTNQFLAVEKQNTSVSYINTPYILGSCANYIKLHTQLSIGLQSVLCDILSDAFGGQIEVLDNLMIDLEEVCEQLDLERRKAAQRLKLSKLRHNRE